MGKTGLFFLSLMVIFLVVGAQKCKKNKCGEECNRYKCADRNGICMRTKSKVQCQLMGGYVKGNGRGQWCQFSKKCKCCIPDICPYLCMNGGTCIPYVEPPPFSPLGYCDCAGTGFTGINCTTSITTTKTTTTTPTTTSTTSTTSTTTAPPTSTSTTTTSSTTTPPTSTSTSTTSTTTTLPTSTSTTTTSTTPPTSTSTTTTSTTTTPPTLTSTTTISTTTTSATTTSTTTTPPTTTSTTTAPPTTTSVCSQPCPACQNGGFCEGPCGPCICQPGQGGPTCEDFYCDPECINGGTCIGPNLCECPPGRNGSICQDFYCEPECQNGGTCIGPNECDCLQDFYGEFCQFNACTEKSKCRGQKGTCFDRDDPILANQTACPSVKFAGNWCNMECGCCFG